MSPYHGIVTVAVVDKNGHPLMPTNSYRARYLKKSGRAVTYAYRPVYTIQMVDVEFDPEKNMVQEIEVKCDTGYEHIGVSVCSEKHEYLHREYDLLTDENEKHNDSRKYRRTRRNRKRHRAARFRNRKGVIVKDGFAPSIRNKRDRHIDIITSLCFVMPITDIHVEMGEFDTQALKAIEEGKPLPQGTDYQYGEQYGYLTLRAAVFSRDNHTCQCCGRNAFRDKAMLHEHHIGFWKGDRTNRMANLLTVCEQCHTPKNHKPGGKLYGLEPKLKGFKGATFMTSVRWNMVNKLKEALPGISVHITYGAATKQSRQQLRLRKTHANDAYAMGNFHPKHRSHLEHFKKRRRNNRVLEKFYDAVYIDTRDGTKKTGSQLGCNRTKRSIPRNNPNNERKYRGEKKSEGHRSIRKQHYTLSPGDKVWCETDKKMYVVNGMQNKGATVQLRETKVVPLDQLQPMKKKGKTVPIAANQKLALINAKEKHTVLSVDEGTNTAVMRWFKGVKPSTLTRVSSYKTGWERIV